MLMATFVLSALFIPRAWRNEQFDQTGWAALVGLSNIVLAGQQDDYFSPGAELNPFLHTWTLGVEEQFYLVFPLLFFVWLRGRERWPGRVGCCRRSPCCRWRGRAGRRDRRASAFYLLPARFWELAAGALLYQWMHERRHARAAAGCRDGPGAAGRGCADRPAVGDAGAGRAGDRGRYPAAVGGRVDSGDIAHRPCAGLRWPTWVGCPYSLYLWHWPLLVLLRWTHGLHGVALWLYPVLLLAVSAASYHFIERPLQCGAAAVAGTGQVLAMAFPLVALCGAGAWPRWSTTSRSRSASPATVTHGRRVATRRGARWNR